MKFVLVLSIALVTLQANSQSADSAFTKADSLQNVTVTAFASGAKWKEVPAAVAVINAKQLSVFNNVSLVPVLNTVTGVRMEERSPGSYRLSLRGSLLRSPFGVRNIKIYWNDIPLTDAGGNTYLQLIDINQLQSIEVIKGPASSLYGANTGGAVILHSGETNTTKANSFHASSGAGSYHLFNEQATWKYSNKKFNSTLQQTHVSSDGYRQQSALRRDAIKWDGSLQINAKEKLSFLAFYTDLYYQTPGGLTQKQMDSLPTQARPRAGQVPGSVEQQAAVYNKTAFTGISLQSVFNNHFDNTTTVTVNHTGFTNPFITNYEKRSEWNLGARTSFRYHVEKNDVHFQWLAGAEWQKNYADIDDYGNRKGVMDTVQFKDKVLATQYFVFTQLSLQLKDNWLFQLGASSNRQVFKYKRLTDVLQDEYKTNNALSLLAPRLSILYRISKDVSAYGIVAKGFSAPATAEVHPASGSFNDSLKAEYGWNYELGFKGALLHNSLLFDISAYSFGLKDAIIRKGTSDNSEAYINAGSTKQKGLEVWLKGFIIKKGHGFISSLSVWNSFSYQPYTFDNYKPSGKDYSGNKLTGVPRTINVSGLEAETRTGIYVNILLNNTSSIPLTDANDAYAKAYHLLQLKLGYHHTAKGFSYQVFGGADNLLNETYSLGNDINAFAKRFFNPAPARNFFAGLAVDF